MRIFWAVLILGSLVVGSAGVSSCIRNTPIDPEEVIGIYEFRTDDLPAGFRTSIAGHIRAHPHPLIGPDGECMIPAASSLLAEGLAYARTLAEDFADAIERGPTVVFIRAEFSEDGTYEGVSYMTTPGLSRPHDQKTKGEWDTTPRHVTVGLYASTHTPPFHGGPGKFSLHEGELKCVFYGTEFKLTRVSE